MFKVRTKKDDRSYRVSYWLAEAAQVMPLKCLGYHLAIAPKLTLFL